MSLSFSIVINTLNRGRWLGDALSGLRGLSYQDFEVVVVNGPSTDDSQAIIDSYAGSIKIGQCADANLAMSRNIGIELAAGDVVAFIDDDAVPSPDWLTQLAHHYTNPAVGGVGGFTIDNTGVRYQVQKTVCDRFGNAKSVSDFFDERPLCFRGSPFYPSLLGTNSSFRRDVLREIGGFDNVFAYLLDETDVCLRIIDAGYEIRYEPRALVYHQFAPSSLRSEKRVPKTLYPSAISKSYFISSHGAREERRSGLDGEVSRQRVAYRDELLRANKWMVEHGEISQRHGASLDQDVLWGIEKGRELATVDKRGQGDLDARRAAAAEPMRPYIRNMGMRIALVSQSFPPDNEAGVARWTSMMARGLSARGHSVHVIALASQQPSVRFEDGFWTHRILPDHQLGQVMMATYDLPPNIASWVAGVALEIDSLRSVGLDVASFPIWDTEGASLPDLDDVAVVMSLHTSYAMALPFKGEWNERPLYRHLMVDKMIAAEERLLRHLPVVLANSEAIVADVGAAYGVDLAERARVVPHGTYDPFAQKPSRRAMRRDDAPVSIAFVGRFEPRKGIDIAVAAFAVAHEALPEAHFHFLGDKLGAETMELFHRHGGAALLASPRVTFHGQVTREVLDDFYATVDIVLMPSRYESFGLVAIEAMAAGAVVVAARAGGLKEVVVEGLTGYLVPLDGSEVAVAADRLIALGRSPKARKAMAQAARELFEMNFQVDLMAARAELVYADAIKLKRKARDYVD
ncbi:MAG: glycosyltransferase [Roseomonas sp.]|nr:glycosyltransferase [Roseomonas sp.]